MEERKAKALVSLEAAVSMIDEGFVDPAASRTYYAMFQAAVHALETRRGMRPGDLRLGADRWGHDMVCGNAKLRRGSREDERLLRALRGLRERADYEPVPVERAAVEGRREAVAAFVRGVTEP
ncbi:MAG: HEPN domain-containing protein [Planctomycetes bacterium]|nr:HEPN domain-containing protein [Planctomycetota bacterium]